MVQEDHLGFDQPEILKLVWEAHADWVDADCFFNFALDPDLIDYAIQTLGATESKYRYLLKQARHSQVIAFDPDLLQEVSQ